MSGLIVVIALILICITAIMAAEDQRERSTDMGKSVCPQCHAWPCQCPEA